VHEGNFALPHGCLRISFCPALLGGPHARKVCLANQVSQQQGVMATGDDVGALFKTVWDVGCFANQRQSCWKLHLASTPVAGSRETVSVCMVATCNLGLATGLLCRCSVSITIRVTGCHTAPAVSQLVTMLLEPEGSDKMQQSDAIMVSCVVIMGLMRLEGHPAATSNGALLLDPGSRVRLLRCSKNTSPT